MMKAVTFLWVTVLASTPALITATGWGDGFKEVTLQYLGTNNKIVNTQVAVPTQVVAGISNLAVQDTSQSATNSISSVNAAGRHLLDDGSKWQKVTLQYLDTNNKIVSTQVAVPTQVLIGKNNLADQETSQSATNSISNVNAAGRHLLNDWSNWQKVTLQYLDANNKVVSTQVAVPTQVVIGNNQAVQATSQDATNSISNANVAGRHLLGDGSKWQKVTLQYLDANNKIVSTQVAVPTQVVIGSDNAAGQGTSQNVTNSIDNANIAGRNLLEQDTSGGAWAGSLGSDWKQVTMQYLDANNQLVNIQVAVPTQVIIGNNNQASQSTSQDAINSIVNENVAGRRLLGGWGDGFKEVTLQYLDTNNKIVNTQVAVPTQVVAGISNLAVQDTSQSATNSISNVNAAGRHLLDDGSKWQKVTLQYLDTNNKIVSTQVAVPTQVVIGKNNQAIQATSQDATNSISNVNSAGRRLLDDWSKWQKVTLQYLDANNQIVSTQVAVPTQVVIGSNNAAGQGTSQSVTNSIGNGNVAGRRLLGGWGDGFKEVTLQYLDANNKIVNQQVALPTQVVIGKDNLAAQATSQSAANSIENVNGAGRRLKF